MVHAGSPGRRRTRVLFIVGSLAGGGAERVISHLVRHLNRDEFDARVGLLWRHGPYLEDVPEDALLVPTFAHGWIPYEDSPRPKHLIPAILLVPLQQAQIIRRFGPDIVVSATKSMNIAARASTAWAGGHRPAWVIREGNNTGAMIDGESRTSSIGRLQNIIVGRFYRRADRIIAISEGVKVGLVQRFGIDPSKITAILNPIDIREIEKRAREQPAASINGPFVVAAGRLTRQKGFDDLLRAHARVTAPRGLRLVILGEGPDRPALVALSRELRVEHMVDLPGFVANPWAFFARAAAFVCSSRWEGFGNVIVEAMACGAPVVSTDCNFGPREILRDRETGLLVPPADPDALAAALGEVLANGELASRLGESGRRRASAFDVSETTKAYEAVFRTLRPDSAD